MTDQMVVTLAIVTIVVYMLLGIGSERRRQGARIIPTSNKPIAPPPPPIIDNGGWTPVSEMLPELYGDKSSDCFLVTDGTFIFMAYFTQNKEWVFAECTNSKKIYLVEIIAWQPLPEPYREENK